MSQRQISLTRSHLIYHHTFIGISISDSRHIKMSPVIFIIHGGISMREMLIAFYLLVVIHVTSFRVLYDRFLNVFNWLI